MTYRILTVCTGNICRSPMAEVVLQQKLTDAGLDVEVDSAAVTPYEVGNPIDYRAVDVMEEAGYDVPHRAARKVTEADFEDYDLILPMTRSHARDLEEFRRAWGKQGTDAQIELFGTFTPKFQAGETVDVDVPDPWYGNRDDFVETLATIEAALPAIQKLVAANS